MEQRSNIGSESESVINDASGRADTNGGGRGRWNMPGGSKGYVTKMGKPGGEGGPGP